MDKKPVVLSILTLGFVTQRVEEDYKKLRNSGKRIQRL